MTPNGLSVRLNLLTANNGARWKSEMWRYIKDQLQGVLISMQRDQLFEKSIGADGVKLGKYKGGLTRVKGRERTRQESRKKAGQEFTMIDSGDFYDDLIVDVDTKKGQITFYSEAGGHIDEMLENPVFITHNFFGLTKRHTTNLINQYIKKHMQEWTLNYLQKEN